MRALPVLLGKVERIRERLCREQERTWSRLILEFRDHLLDVLHGEQDLDLGHADVIDRCARLLDSCDLVEKHVLARDVEVVEAPVDARDGHDAGTLGELIDYLLDGAPKRGFVYVAWNVRPETYLYIGKAGREDRIRRIRAHGNLSLALRDATCFTLIFGDRETRLESVEAALLNVLHATDSYPRHNGPNPPRAPRGRRVQRIEEMSKDLRRIADRWS